MNHPAGDGDLRGVLKTLLGIIAMVFRRCANGKLAGCDSWNCNHVGRIPYLGGLVNTARIDYLSLFLRKLYFFTCFR